MALGLPGLVNFNNMILVNFNNMIAENFNNMITENLLRRGFTLPPIQPIVADIEETQLKSSKFHKMFANFSKFLQDVQSTDGYLNQIDTGCDMTPLMASAAVGRADLTLKLLDIGASPDVQNLNGMTALAIACALENEDIVDILIERNANLNLRDRIGFTALMIAIVLENENIAQKLLAKKVNIHLCHPGKIDAMHVASERGLNDTVKLLIETGFSVNSSDVDGWTPLMKCAQFNHYKILKLLVANNADVHAENHAGNTVLHICILHGALDILDFLLECKVDVNIANKYGHTPLILAAQKGNAHLVRKLLANMSAESINATDKEGCTALLYAAFTGNKNCIELLLETKANPKIMNYSGVTPLMCASQSGCTKIIKLLDPHLKSDQILGVRERLEALIKAIEHNNKNAVKIILLKHKNILHSIDSAGYERHLPLLQTAATHKNVNILRQLLDAGVSVNSQDKLSQTALFISAKLGYEDVLKVLLEKNANVNLTNRNGDTPLITASFAGHLNIVKLLLKSKAFPNHSNIYGCTALMVAAFKGSLEIVETLCSANCDVNIADSNGWTALMIAETNTQTKIIRYLLEKGASLQVSSRHGVTSMMLNAARGIEEIMEICIKQIGDVNEKDVSGNTPLLHAAMNGHVRTVNILLQNKADVNVYDLGTRTTALSWSAILGNNTMGLLLLKAGAKINWVNSDSHSPLHLAAMLKHQAFVELLLTKGATVDLLDRNYRTALMLAAGVGDSESVRHLLKHANGNLCSADGWTPLMFCCQHGFTECMEIVLNSNINIDAVQNSGHSALSISAANGHGDAVYLLLDKGASVNLANNLRQTPLMLSAMNGHTGIVRLLLNAKKKALLEQCDQNGKTALLYAAETNQTLVVKLLLDAGANINAVSKQGLTALNISVRNGNIKNINELSSRNADFEIADEEGDTPLLASAKRGYHTILKCLLDNGANVNKINNKGESALEISIRIQCVSSVTYLSRKSQVTEKKKAALILLSKQGGQLEIIEMVHQLRVTSHTFAGNTANSDSTPSGHSYSTSLTERQEVAGSYEAQSGRTEGESGAVEGEIGTAEGESGTAEGCVPNVDLSETSLSEKLKDPKKDKSIIVEVTNDVRVEASKLLDLRGAQIKKIIFNMNTSIESATNVCSGPGGIMNIITGSKDGGKDNIHDVNDETD